MQIASAKSDFFDTLAPESSRHHGKRITEIIADIGVNFDPLADPAMPFTRAGYRETQRESVVCAGFKYQRLGWLRPLLRLVYPNVVSGYTIATFV